MSIPTDEEYLNLLYDHLVDHDFADRFERVPDEYIRSCVNELISEGRYSEEERDYVEDLLREQMSPQRIYQGQLITAIREQALSILEPFRPQLEKIPLGFITTRQLNACAVSTPSGGAVILLDSPVMVELEMVMKASFGFMTWHWPEPYCHHHHWTAFGDTIVLLAHYVNTGNLEFLRRIKTWSWECTSPHKLEPRVRSAYSVMRTSVLMHEYGHVVLGHLKSQNTTHLTAGGSMALQMYTKSQNQEFEADKFAYDQLSKQEGKSIHPGDAAFGMGLLLNFFTLCEALAKNDKLKFERTHPPASDRWSRLMKLAGITGDKHNLDRTFALIFQALRLNPDHYWEHRP
jgi:hypothetical protein